MTPCAKTNQSPLHPCCYLSAQPSPRLLSSSTLPRSSLDSLLDGGFVKDEGPADEHHRQPSAHCEERRLRPEQTLVAGWSLWFLANLLSTSLRASAEDHDGN